MTRQRRWPWIVGGGAVAALIAAAFVALRPPTVWLRLDPAVAGSLEFLRRNVRLIPGGARVRLGGITANTTGGTPGAGPIAFVLALPDAHVREDEPADAGGATERAILLESTGEAIRLPHSPWWRRALGRVIPSVAPTGETRYVTTGRRVMHEGHEWLEFEGPSPFAGNPPTSMRVIPDTSGSR